MTGSFRGERIKLQVNLQEGRGRGVSLHAIVLYPRRAADDADAQSSRRLVICYQPDARSDKEPSRTVDIHEGWFHGDRAGEAVRGDAE